MFPARAWREPRINPVHRQASSCLLVVVESGAVEKLCCFFGTIFVSSEKTNGPASHNATLGRSQEDSNSVRGSAGFLRLFVSSSIPAARATPGAGSIPVQRVPDGSGAVRVLTESPIVRRWSILRSRQMLQSELNRGPRTAGIRGKHGASHLIIDSVSLVRHISAKVDVRFEGIHCLMIKRRLDR